MATFLFDSHIIGPIHSRRLGNSLGINLLSTYEKVCNFNCIYCECGWTPPKWSRDKFVNTDQLLQDLEQKLHQYKKENMVIDYITYAGNGEPTLHPKFLVISKTIKKLRDQYYPDCKIALLSNGTTLLQESVIQAFDNIDDCILKLDAGTQDMLQLINDPIGQYKLTDLVKRMIPFKEKVIIQTMFIKGQINDEKFDNSHPNMVEKWVELISMIQPQYVQIYSIARDTPAKDIQKIPQNELHKIACQLKYNGIEAKVY